MTDLMTQPIDSAAVSDDDAEQIERARRLFELQRGSRWRIAATDARVRIARLRWLRKAILAPPGAVRRRAGGTSGSPPIYYGVLRYVVC